MFYALERVFELILHLGLVLFLFFRVLAIQTAEQFEALGAGMGFKCAVVSFWPKLVLNRHY